MPNLFRNSKGWAWRPDCDQVNAPDGALLNATNMVPDQTGTLSLRAGSAKLYTGLQPKVHSIYSAELGGRVYRFLGADDKLYNNGVDFGVTFDGQGDVAMGDDAYQTFFARGTIKKKFDGTNLYNWSIPAPEFAATLSAVAALTTEIASFNTAESPAFVINEGTSAFVTGWDGTGSGALKLTPAASGRASASKKFASDQNFFNISGGDGGDTDLFDIYVWIEEPTKVDKITVMFGLGTGSDAYVTDYYYFDFSIRDPSTVDLKDAGSTAASAYSIINDQIQSVLSPDEVTNIKTPEQVTAVLKRLGRFAGPRSRERKDSQEASPAWTHLSVTRGQFNRVGGTAGRNWSTVRAFKVVYTAFAGDTHVVQFDQAVWTGGGDRSLTGKYMLGYRFVRDFGPYQELSPIGPISHSIELTQQALQVTIPGQALSGKDPQVNQIWVYLFGGFLDTYYRFNVVGAVIRQGMTIDELTNPAGSDFNTAGERTRLGSWGFTRITGDVPSSDLVFTINKSELEALIENERLEPGVVGVPDNVVAVVGPFNSRMFVLTKEGRLYPSSQDNPSSFSLYQHLDLRRYGDPLWAILTNSGICIGMSKDVVRIGGTGDESADGITADLFPLPLHVGNPPVDGAVATDGNSIIYRSSDGPMLLSGVTLVPVPFADTSLLWRGQTRYGVSALNTTYGRFRFALDRHILFMLGPEGTSYNPPLTAEEDISWVTLSGLSLSGTTLTKTAASGFANTTAISSKTLDDQDGYVEVTATETTTERYVGLTTKQASGGDPTMIDYAIRFRNDGQIDIYENGVAVSSAIVPYVAGDQFRVEVLSDVVYYKKNSVLIYTSTLGVVYPFVVDIALNTLGSTLGEIVLSGTWTLIANSTSSVWRLDLTRQQWSRTSYPVNFMSIRRDFQGKLIAGTDGGEVWELETGRQDNGQDINISILTPIDDGGDPLGRKDALDFQVHADTGGKDASVGFLLDGDQNSFQDFTFNCSQPDVFRINALALRVLLKAQLSITGAFSRFYLYAVNLQYRNRVQQVMVLDTGTIAPQGQNRITWLTEAEIDCISPVDLRVSLYLDDVLKTVLSIVVLPNRRSSYRFSLPRGSKARAPRLVFETTNANGAGDVGFEAYRVRVRDRGTGTQQESEFRPVWPVGIAP